MTIWYSPTENLASIFTPRSPLRSRAIRVRPGAPLPAAIAMGGGMGAHGSSSQYSTRRGAASVSTLRKISRGSVLTFSFWSTTGTGTTIAKFSGGPW
jgi:hypothetical protein